SSKPDARPRFINARNASFCATSSHVAMLEGGCERTVGELSIGDRLEACAYPQVDQACTALSESQAEFLGLLASDGWVSKDGGHLKITSASADVRQAVIELWHSVGGRGSTFNPSVSGFDSRKMIGQVVLSGMPAWLKQISLYNDELTP